MAKARCPVCDETVGLGASPEVDTVIECPHCGAALIVRRMGRRWILEVFEEENEEEEDWP